MAAHNENYWEQRADSMRAEPSPRKDDTQPLPFRGREIVCTFWGVLQDAIGTRGAIRGAQRTLEQARHVQQR